MEGCLLTIFIFALLIIYCESYHYITSTNIRRNRIKLYDTPNEIKKITADDIIKINDEVSTINALLIKASNKQISDTDSIVTSLLQLEKLMRKKNTYDENTTSQNTLQALQGDWRLIFTTGTVNTQKKIGKINYFPIKAVQSFDTSVTPYKISNGIYIGDFTILKFFGNFTWSIKSRKLEFDFNEIYFLGFNFNLPQGKAQEIGGSTGLGNKSPKRPFFNWISANEYYATARGGGGGLALWKKQPKEQ